MCVNSFISLKKDDISESIATVVKFPGIPDRESGGAEFPGIPEWELPVALFTRYDYAACQTHSTEILGSILSSAVYGQGKPNLLSRLS